MVYYGRMTKSRRTVLFIVVFLVFAAAAPTAVFYSQGYRLDISPAEGKVEITQTGALYFKIWPKNAGIYLDGALKDKTDFIFGSALIGNLLPQKYIVEVKKEGYFPWSKSLELTEKRVTEAKNIILIPEELKFETLATTTKEISNILTEINISQKTDKNFKTVERSWGTTTAYSLADSNILWWEFDNLYHGEEKEQVKKTLVDEDIKEFSVAPDGKKLVYFNNYEIWIFYLEDYYGDFSKSKWEKVFLTRFSEEIGTILWINPHYLMFSVGNTIKISEVDERDRINIYDLARFKNPQVFWDEEEKKIYILTQGTLLSSARLLP